MRKVWFPEQLPQPDEKKARTLDEPEYASSTKEVNSSARKDTRLSRTGSSGRKNLDFTSWTVVLGQRGREKIFKSMV